MDDRTQIADIDPSMVIEEYDDAESPPCPRCGKDDNEDVLILCDGCDMGYHTYCVDLESVPAGHWFCDDCTINQPIEPVTGSLRTQHRSASRRTRAQQRRSRQRAQAASSNWARVWQSVWDHLNIDLDFPYHDSQTTSQRRPIRRRNYQAWERRFEVAERQGASHRLQDIASELGFDRPTLSRPRIEPPEPESVEELLAWNALEKARDIEADPIKTRKRKSATNSPSERDSSKRRRMRKSATTSPTDFVPAPQPERPLKRPQTRRIHNIQDVSSDSAAEASTPRRQSAAAITSTHTTEPMSAGTGPSFLKSLLKEVESSAAPEESKGQNRLQLTMPYAIHSDHSSPRYSSPGASPTASNHPSPRPLSTTPPPLFSGRAGSEVPLTSNVEPIYSAPEFFPERSPLLEPLPHRPNRASLPFACDSRRSRPSLQGISDSSPPQSHEATPTRANMPLSAKEDIQKLVKDALKVPYKNKEVSKEQYTEINRTVSRMLYDEVGESANLSSEAVENWKRMANEEVAKAVQSLRGTASTTAEL